MEVKIHGHSVLKVISCIVHAYVCTNVFQYDSFILSSRLLLIVVVLSVHMVSNQMRSMCLQWLLIPSVESSLVIVLVTLVDQ